MAILLLSASLLSAQASAMTTEGGTGTATTVIEVDTAVTALSSGSAQSVSVAVPDGFTPVRVTGLLTPATPGDGVVEVIRQGSVAAGYPIDALATLDLEVDSSDVTDGYLGFSFRVRTATAEGLEWCTTAESVSVTLDHVQVTMTGTMVAPTTVASFFSPAVTDVRVLLPDRHQEATAEAALTAAGAIASGSDHRTTVRVTIESEAPPATGGTVTAVSRSVRLVEGDNPVTTDIAATADGVPELVLTGSGAELVDAARSLGSPALAIAGAARTTGLTQQGSAVPSLTSTLAGFGTEQVHLSGYGSTESYTGVTQDAFGGPVSALTLTLVGTATALPAAITATAAVYWNDYLIDSFVLGETTAFTREVTIDGTLINQSNGLRVRLAAVPSDGRCRSTDTMIPVELHVDGAASTLTATRGDNGAVGFQRFPQVLGGYLPVALGDGAEASISLRAAGDLVVSLQRAASSQLLVDLVTVAELTASTSSGLLVGATAADFDGFAAPFRLAEFRTINTADVELGVGTSEPYAVLAAFQTGARSMLLLGGWSPDGSDDPALGALLLEAGAYPVRDSSGWLGLYNTLLLAQPGDASPVLLTTNAVVPQPEVTEDYRWYAGWLVVVIGVLLLAGLLGWAWRRRAAKARSRRYVDAQQRAEAEARSRSRGR